MSNYGLYIATCPEYKTCACSLFFILEDGKLTKHKFAFRIEHDYEEVRPEKDKGKPVKITLRIKRNDHNVPMQWLSGEGEATDMQLLKLYDDDNVDIIHYGGMDLTNDPEFWSDEKELLQDWKACFPNKPYPGMK